MSYEVVKSELLAKGAIMEYYRDTLMMPNGKEAIREYVVRGGGASAVVPITEEGKIVFVRQYRHPIHSYTLEIPAGMLEKEEDPKICAIRELEEEIGKKCEDLQELVQMHSAVGICTELITIYLAENMKPGKQHFDPDEFIDLEEYTLEEAIQMIFEGKITDSKTIAGIFAYQEILKKREA